jgi:hypothetical protein
MTHDKHLPERPEIGEARGWRTDSLVFSVDGLCVAIVDQPSMLKTVAEDLTRVMSERRSPSGSLLLGPSDRPELPMAYRKELASLGISVKRSNTDDLVSAAKGILNDFWRRHRVNQMRYQAAQNRG